MMKKFNHKLLFIIVVFIIITSTAIICSIKPKARKPFQFNVIQFLMEINSDGSVSKVKKTTTHLIKGN